MIQAVSNPYIHIISHPGDGTAKLHFEPVVLAAKAHHTLLEINNSSLRPCRHKVEARDNSSGDSPPLQTNHQDGLAAAAARFANCKEWLNVPGATSDISRISLLLMFDNSTNVTLEVNPNVFSRMNSSG